MLQKAVLLDCLVFHHRLRLVLRLARGNLGLYLFILVIFLVALAVGTMMVQPSRVLTQTVTILGITLVSVTHTFK